jgi:hypothetical protein
MGACTSQSPVGLPTSSLPLPSFPSFPGYTGAGILFASGPVALAGIQKYWRVAKQGGDKGNRPHGVLSGLGGRKEAADADWLDTAWREVVEELFHLKAVPAALLQALRSHIPLPIPPLVICTSGYVLLHLGFVELEVALGLCRTHGIQSELYTTMPTTVAELVLKRSPSPDAELGPLALLPVAHRVVISEQFAGDLAYRRQNTV